MSKAEGRFVDLCSVAPSTRAQELARITGKDARLVEVVLAETDEAVRAAPNVLIVRHRLGSTVRYGVVNVALGVAGLPAVIDRRGETDRYGRTLEMTEVAYADAITAGAALVMGEAVEGTPVVLVRGCNGPRRTAMDKD